MDCCAIETLDIIVCRLSEIVSFHVCKVAMVPLVMTTFIRLLRHHVLFVVTKRDDGWELCVALFPLRRCALNASCRCQPLWALFVCFRSVLLVRAHGPALCLGVCLLGLPAVVCAVTPAPSIASLCNIVMVRHAEAIR